MLQAGVELGNFIGCLPFFFLFLPLAQADSQGFHQGAQGPDHIPGQHEGSEQGDGQEGEKNQHRMADDPFHAPLVLGETENDLHPAQIGNRRLFHRVRVEIQGGLVLGLARGDDPPAKDEVPPLVPMVGGKLLLDGGVLRHESGKAVRFFRPNGCLLGLGRSQAGKDQLAVLVVDQHGRNIGCPENRLHVGADLLHVHEKKRRLQVAGQHRGNESPLVVCLIQQGLPLAPAEKQNQAAAAKHQNRQKGKEQLEAIAQRQPFFLADPARIQEAHRPISGR